MKNQMNQINQQQNRFLESPFVIRDTSPEGSFVFGTTDAFSGGTIFKKEGFLLPLGYIEEKIESEAGNNEELDDENKKYSE